MDKGSFHTPMPGFSPVGGEVCFKQTCRPGNAYEKAIDGLRILSAFDSFYATRTHIASIAIIVLNNLLKQINSSLWYRYDVVRRIRREEKSN